MPRLTSTILSLLLLVAGCNAAHADNIFKKIARGLNIEKTDSISDTSDGDENASVSKTRLNKKGKQSKKAEITDPYELSLDENLSTPAVSEKLSEDVADYMNGVAKKLAQRKVARIETMRAGEVIVATISTDLLFSPNDTVLRSTAPEILAPYRALLGRVDMFKLVVACHTDDTGSTLYTDHLSEARANAIDTWMSRNLTDDSVLVPYAMGASEPLYPNDSQSHRAANRRVEIFIIPSTRLIDLAKAGKLADTL